MFAHFTTMFAGEEKGNAKHVYQSTVVAKQTKLSRFFYLLINFFQRFFQGN